LQKCAADAKKYNSRGEWSVKSGGGYRAARMNGWLNESCAHMKSRYKPSGFWNKENCKLDALKYQSKNEWISASISAYSNAQKNGWLKECCDHMTVTRQSWTLKLCLKEARRFQTKTDWSEGNQSSYQAARKNDWLEKCCKHMEIIRGKWTLETCHREANKYQTKKDWLAGSPGSYSAATKSGWVTECSKHMTVLMGKWTKEACTNEARKFKTRSEWLVKSVGSYSAARASGWLKACSPHMENGRVARGGWTKEHCITTARKYKSKSEWKKGSPGSQRAAIKNGWFDTCCSHMKALRKAR
jgi:hypothetical protein